VVAPAIWFASDWLVTGDVLYSLHYTTRSAELLGRQRSIADLPSETYRSLVSVLRTGGLVAGVVGFALAWRLARKHMLISSVLLFAGLGTYAILVAGGFTVIPRYLLVSALALLLFAAFAIGGFDVLGAGDPSKRHWAYASAAAVSLAVIYSIATLNVGYIDRDLTLRGDARRGLEQILDDPRVVSARRCGRVAVPTYKLIPDTRWLLHARPGEVVARTESDYANGDQRGVALLVVGNRLMNNPAYGPLIDFAKETGEHDPPLRTSVPPPGSQLVAGNRYFAAYAVC
jgi:hypothetical protein